MSLYIWHWTGYLGYSPFPVLVASWKTDQFTDLLTKYIRHHQSQAKCPASNFPPIGFLSTQCMASHTPIIEVHWIAPCQSEWPFVTGSNKMFFKLLRVKNGQTVSVLCARCDLLDLHTNKYCITSAHNLIFYDIYWCSAFHITLHINAKDIPVSTDIVWTRWAVL